MKTNDELQVDVIMLIRRAIISANNKTRGDLERFFMGGGLWRWRQISQELERSFYDIRYWDSLREDEDTITEE